MLTWGSSAGALGGCACCGWCWRPAACSGVVLKVLPVFNQDNWRLIALILPISLGFAGAFHLDRLLARIRGFDAASRSGQPLLLP